MSDKWSHYERQAERAWSLTYGLSAEAIKREVPRAAAERLLESVYELRRAVRSVHVELSADIRTLSELLETLSDAEFALRRLLGKFAVSFAWPKATQPAPRVSAPTLRRRPYHPRRTAKTSSWDCIIENTMAMPEPGLTYSNVSVPFQGTAGWETRVPEHGAAPMLDVSLFEEFVEIRFGRTPGFDFTAHAWLVKWATWEVPHGLLKHLPLYESLSSELPISEKGQHLLYRSGKEPYGKSLVPSAPSVGSLIALSEWTRFGGLRRRRYAATWHRLSLWRTASGSYEKPTEGMPFASLDLIQEVIERIEPFPPSRVYSAESSLMQMHLGPCYRPRKLAPDAVESAEASF